jgi:hypothetical protein
VANDNQTLLIAVLVIGALILAPQLTGNYANYKSYSSYSSKLDECSSPGESFCDSLTNKNNGVYKVCIYDAATGTNKWSEQIFCESGQYCRNKQVSYGVNQARCEYRHQRNT